MHKIIADIHVVLCSDKRNFFGVTMWYIIFIFLDNELTRSIISIFNDYIYMSRAWRIRYIVISRDFKVFLCIFQLFHKPP